MNHPYPTPDEIWADYTGGESPRDFVVRLGGDSAEACVDAHLGTLPDAMGILRNGNWGHSFRQPWQLRRIEVRHGLLAYLEQHHSTWAVGSPVEEVMERDAMGEAGESAQEVLEAEGSPEPESKEAVEATAESESGAADQLPADPDDHPEPGENLVD